MKFSELLEQDVDKKLDGEAVKKAKRFYKMCLNECKFIWSIRKNRKLRQKLFFFGKINFWTAFWRAIFRFGTQEIRTYTRKGKFTRVFLENLHKQIKIILAEITNTWRAVFDEVRREFGGWPSLEPPGAPHRISIERLYGIMVAKFRADSLFKATVQPDDKNSEKHVLLVRNNITYEMFWKQLYYINISDWSTSSQFVCSRLLHVVGDRRWTFGLQNVGEGCSGVVERRCWRRWKRFHRDSQIWNWTGQCEFVVVFMQI